MTAFSVNKDVFTGQNEIDDAHQEIAELSQSMEHAIEGGLPFGEVYKLFQRLAEVITTHFELEESLLDSYRDDPDVAAHIEKHHENHAFFRNVLKYTETRFQDRIRSGKIPNIAGVLPKEYLDELIDLDLEMVELLKKHRPG